jgi:polysaccharide biosynthesis/export protein
MKLKKQNLGVFLFLAILLSSCESSKKIAYFQNYIPDSIDTAGNVSNIRFKPKDILAITITSSEPEATKNYNLIMPQISDITSVSNGLMSQPTLQTVLVNTDGSIEYPALGKIKISGLSKVELENLFYKSLENAFTDEKPIITVRLTNFTINVIGEVNKPGRYLVNNDRITILEALALAGDLTIYGRRDNVKLLREHSDGSKEFLVINLNNKDILNSPTYYLEQNDVIYVQPNKARSRSSGISSAESLSVSVVSIFISIIF